MEHVARYQDPNDSRWLFDVVRAVPDHWDTIIGSLTKPDQGQSTGLISENTLRIDGSGARLFSESGLPDLMGLFAGSRRIEAVVFEKMGLDPAAPDFRLCRALASGLVERGYLGEFEMSLHDRRHAPPPAVVRLKLKLVPAAGSLVELRYDPDACPPLEVEALLRTCDNLKLVRL